MAKQVPQRGLSNDQRTINIVALFGTVVIDFTLPLIAEVVEPDAVGLLFDDVEKLGFEGDELGGIHLAFEYGILHPLAVIKTGLGHTAEPRPPGRGDGGNIVGNENVHRLANFRFQISKCRVRSSEFRVRCIGWHGFEILNFVI